MKIHYADPLSPAERFDVVANRAGDGLPVSVSMSGEITDETFDRLVVIDRGDDRSFEMLRSALVYRERHPQCDLMLLSRIDPTWTPAEVLSRVASLRGAIAFPLSEKMLGDVLSQEKPVEVRITPEQILFEYAA